MMTMAQYGFLLFLIWLFVSAGLNKLNPANRHGFRDIFNMYGITHRRLADLVIILVGSTEVMVALALVFPSTSQLAIKLAGLLLSLYLLLMISQLLRGRREVKCGCSSSALSLNVSYELLVRNLILIVLCGVSGDTPSPGTWEGWLNVSMLAIFIIVLYLSADQLIANHQRIRLMRRQ
ncbi:hypothetical protein L2725_05640 [Shewanella corallii]|uniref:Methylamine utilization protein MauE n=1 Tax=Shewanella corallii TaxID=560080 RepID=A0ABT0N4C1_9GAMM|nr:MauE/DoxX family redox-associated membrane protein [Shewanella corallii]MCL2913268.1 hypothetical protein [Shewanella corallii]